MNEPLSLSKVIILSLSMAKLLCQFIRKIDSNAQHLNQLQINLRLSGILILHDAEKPLVNPFLKEPENLDAKVRCKKELEILVKQRTT